MFRICGTRSQPRVVNTTTGSVWDVYPYQAQDLKEHKMTPFWVLRRYDGGPVITQYGPDGLPALDDVHVDITPRCNLRCSHCYQECGEAGSDMDWRTFDSICRQAALLGAARIAISGGEPTLHPYLARFRHLIEQYGLVFTALFTNGSDPRRAFYLTPPWTQILISHSPAVGQGLTGDKLQRIADITMDMVEPQHMVTFSTITLDGSELDDMFTSMCQLSPRLACRIRWRVGVARPVGRGTGLRVDLDSTRRAYERLFHRWVKIHRADLFEFQIGFAFRSTFVKCGYMDLYRPDANCCAYKDASMCVKWDGRVTACTMDEKPVGRADDLAGAWSNMIKGSYRCVPSSSIEACKGCALRPTCNGGCRLCASEGECDPVSKMTYEFMDTILPELRRLGVRIGGSDDDSGKGSAAAVAAVTHDA